jgi:uncharacterized OB-fold protein
MREEERKSLAQIYPRLEALNRPFWEGLAQNKLMIQKCSACGCHQFPPSVFCVKCHSEKIEWVAASGKAKLWSTVVFHKDYLKVQYPAPFRVIYAKLEEGPLLLARMALETEAAFDSPLRATFHKTEDGSYLLGFELAK